MTNTIWDAMWCEKKIESKDGRAAMAHDTRYNIRHICIRGRELMTTATAHTIVPPTTNAERCLCVRPETATKTLWMTYIQLVYDASDHRLCLRLALFPFRFFFSSFPTKIPPSFGRCVVDTVVGMEGRLLLDWGERVFNIKFQHNFNVYTLHFEFSTFRSIYLSGGTHGAWCVFVCPALAIFDRKKKRRKSKSPNHLQC